MRERGEGRNQGRGSSDPLPYIEVDRAVYPKAQLLATALSMPFQFVLGALIMLWGLCGDPRELEALVRAGKEVVAYPEEEVRRRLLMSFGREVDVQLFIGAGLLERLGGELRVRGMSRFFKPIIARVRAKDAASIGGKASAAARRAATGTAQPPSANRSGTVPDRSGNGLNSDGGTSENAEVCRTVPNPSDQRTSISVHHLTTTTAADGEQLALIEPQAAEQESGQTRSSEPSTEVMVYEEIQCIREEWFKEHGLPFVPDEPPDYGRITATVRAVARRTGRGLEVAHELFLLMLDEPYWASTEPATPGGKRRTPFPFYALASTKVSTGLFEKLQRAEADAA